MARPALKKADIIEAAINLFATKGLARTSIRDIASTAEVTEGALYRHWDGKEAMAWALYCQELSTFAEAFREQLNWSGIRGDSPATAVAFADRLRAGITFVYEYYRANPKKFAFILLTQHGFLEKQYEPESPYEIVEQIVAAELAAMTGGSDQVTEEIKFIAALMLGATLEPIKYHWRGWVVMDPIDRVDIAVTGCLGLMGALIARMGK